MRGFAQKDCMTKCLWMICVCLSGLVLLAGCTGTPSAPPQPQPQVVQPVEAVPRREGVPPSNHGQDARDTGLAAEPNEMTTSHVPETGPTQAAQMGGRVKAEGPGDGEWANHRQAALDDATRPVEDPGIRDLVNKPATAEAERAVVGKQETVEPNETTAGVGEPDAATPDANDNPQSEIRNPKSAPPAASAYADLLQSDVREDGSVEHSSLRRRRLELKQMLMELSELDPNRYAGWSNDEKLAFWINTYNLKLLEIIARNYPIQSSWWLRLTWPPSDIRHIPGIWTDYKFIVMGEEFTLAEVERRFFHRTFNDPRAYLAISYACRSGPPLRRTPYEGERLARQLDEQVKAFLASGRGLRIDRRAMVVHLSAIFKPTWRGKEFVARYGTDKKFKDRDPETRAVLSFISGYLSREDAYFLETENYTIEYTNFDWRLNDSSRGY